MKETEKFLDKGIMKETEESAYKKVEGEEGEKNKQRLQKIARDQ